MMLNARVKGFWDISVPGHLGCLECAHKSCSTTWEGRSWRFRKVRAQVVGHMSLCFPPAFSKRSREFCFVALFSLEFPWVRPDHDHFTRWRSTTVIAFDVGCLNWSRCYYGCSWDALNRGRDRASTVPIKLGRQARSCCALNFFSFELLVMDRFQRRRPGYWYWMTFCRSRFTDRIRVPEICQNSAWNIQRLASGSL